MYFGNSAGASRMKNFAKALAQENSIYFFSSDNENSYSKNNIYEVEKNIFVEKKVKNSKNKYLKKLLYPFYLLLFIVKVFSFSKQLNSRVVFYLYPSTKILLNFLTVLYLIKIRKQRVFYEANELRIFSPSLKIQTPLHKNPGKYLYKKFVYSKFKYDEALIKYYDGLICISTNIQNYLKKYGTKTIIVPILTDFNNIIHYNQTTYTKDEKFKICFGGMINVKKENLELFFKALSLLNKNFSNFEFNMYGPITAYEKSHIFNHLIDRYALKNKVQYLGNLSQKELSTVYSNYHLLVIPRGFNLQNHYGFSTKLSEYLLSSSPVLVTNVSDNSLFIKDSFNGFIVEPDNPKQMADKLFEIIMNYNNLIDDIRKNSENMVKNKFHYMVYSDKINEFVWEE